MDEPRESRDRILEGFQPEILAYLFRLLGNRCDAEDACQDTFLKAYRALGRLEENSNARAWLYKIATNTALNVLKLRTRTRARDTDIDPEMLAANSRTEFDHREKLRVVARAVQALPVKQRAAIMQRRFQELSYEEIALTLGCSAASARANVYQAIKKLRIALTK